TPIGTPPNAVALAALRLKGYDISFIEWMLLAVPLVVVCLVVAAALLLWFFPPGKQQIKVVLDQPKRIDLRGKLTLIIMGISIVLWLTGIFHGVADAVV